MFCQRGGTVWLDKRSFALYDQGAKLNQEKEESSVTQPVGQPPQFLVVAAPGVAGAQVITEVLNQNGWQAVLVHTPEHIVWPRKAALVVLTPATKDDPVIAALASIPGLPRVPIFAEPMVLPHGDWLSAPVLLAANAPDTLRAVLEAVFGVAPQAQSAASLLAAPPAPERHRERGAIFGIGALVLSVIVVIAGIFVMTNRPGGHLLGVAATATPPPSYTSETPGLYCDHGHAVWRKSQNVQITCAANGTLLNVQKDDGYLEYTTFEPLFSTIPNDYRLDVQTTFESGDANTMAYLTVHEQVPYGCQFFAARANGSWFIERLNKQGHFDGELDGGRFDTTAKTLNLQVEVHGGNMVYTINGQNVSSITDNTYLSSVNLAFGVFDPHGTKPYSALFTHFVYTPLP